MITASIVTFYKKDLSKLKNKIIILENCIKELANNKLISELAIIDNSPNDKLNYLSKISIKIKYIHMKGANIGYGKGHNVAKKILKKSNYHIIVNPDIIFSDKDLINKLKIIMDKRNDLAMIQPLIKDPYNGNIQKLCKKNPTLLIQFIRSLLGKYINKISPLKKYNDWYEMEKIAYKDCEVESEFLSGCFMFIRRKNLDNVNWFSEEFFLYLEDADLTRKLAKTGKCLHYPSLSINHVWDRGSYKFLKLKFIAIKSFFIYSKKWGLEIF